MTTIRRLGAADARVIGDALYWMAQADGTVDPREVSVIEGFLRECATPVTEPSFAAPDGTQLARATDGLRDAFLFACASLAFADGDFTAEEAVLLRRYAADLGVPQAHLEELVWLVEREQSAPASPEPLGALMEAIGGWSRQHFPQLRDKVARVFTGGG